MTDRTSYSYRADTPGSNPDMHQIGGKAREAFKRERMSPYIAAHSQGRADGKAQGQADMVRAEKELDRQRKEVRALDNRRSIATVRRDERDFAKLEPKVDQAIQQSREARAKTKFLKRRKAPAPTLAPSRAR